jgi:hypothetical protein
MMRVWCLPELRPTKDIDMLGRTENDEAEIIAQIRDILSLDVDTDGIVFDADSIQTERITEGADYEGIRIRFLGALDSVRINMQVDIGFGDVVFPGPEKSDFPTILNFSTPRLLCYSRESSISEKLEAMVKLGILNSRMKDFYDIWLLSRQFTFDGAKLTEAIRRTFERRGTVLPAEIEIFTEPFIVAKQTQWAAFRKRLKQSHIPSSFREIMASVSCFLSPIITALNLEKVPPNTWNAPGPWT